MGRPHSSLHRKALLALGFALVAGASLSRPAPAAAAPAVSMALSFEKLRLDNGLEVILREDHRTPVVAVNVWYHVGSKDEAAGKNGFAHLFEHMMFQGSRHVGEDMFMRYLDGVGATEHNGTTNTDRTSYFETVPRGRLELALWLESDRMAFLLDHVNQTTFDTQRDVVKNERREKYENVPYGLLPEVIRGALFGPGHPYGRLTIGTPRDLDSATLDDVRAFFRAFYVPNNATLVIAGDLDAGPAKELVARYFAPITRGPDAPVHRAPAPPSLDHERRLLVEADVELARVYVSWPTPPMFAEGDAELDALSKILANGKTSRLYKRLVYDLQIAQHVGARQSSAELASVFEVVATVKRGTSPDQVLGAIDAELALLRKEAPGDDEMTRARARLVTSVVFAEERVSYQANSLNSYNHFTSDPGFLSKDLARYDALAPEAVRRAAETLLPPGRRVVTIVRPSATAPRAGVLREST